MQTAIFPTTKPSMDGFRIEEFKPRKASFGFRTIIRGDNILHVGDLLRRELGEEDKTKWFIELKSNARAVFCEATVYVNDTGLADKMRAHVGKFL